MLTYIKTARQNVLKRDNKIYILPHPALSPYIAHYTFAYPAGPELPGYLSLIPDASGCLVLTFSGTDIECSFFGPSSQMLMVENQKSTTPLMIFVEFMPSGSSRLLHLNLSDLMDQMIPLEDISLHFHNELKAIIYDNLDQSEYIALISDALDKLFLSYLNQLKSQDAVTNVMNFLHHHNSIVTVRELTNVSLYSERHLNRLFSSAIGTNAKSYLRLHRINHAVKVLKKSNLSLTDLAQNMGYYDQAHFIHDFKSVCGVTPGEYRLNMSAFYNEDFKFQNKIIP